MNKTLIAKPLLILLLIAAGLPSEARTGYINDEVEVTLRTGESTKNSIVRMLPSGEKLEVLDINEGTGYAKVVTGDGKDGFVLSRFITYEPIARDKLISANRRLERNAEKIATLDAELRELKSQNTTYSKSQGQFEVENARLKDELAEIRRTAAGALQLAEENRSLKLRETNLETQINEMQARNTILAARSRQSWYLAGAGTIIAGILAGLILPRIKFKRKSRWGDL